MACDQRKRCVSQYVVQRGEPSLPYNCVKKENLQPARNLEECFAISVRGFMSLSSSVSFPLECLGEAGRVGVECRPSIWSQRMVEDKARRVCPSRTQLSPYRESELIYSESSRGDMASGTERKPGGQGALEVGEVPSPGKRVKS